MVDAKSAYVMGVTLQAKNVPHLKVAFEKAFNRFRAYGHTPKLISSDDEA
jgi:hypothetical protein